MKTITWQTNVKTYEFEGKKYLSWKGWAFTFRLCKIWFSRMYYDGWTNVLSLGIGELSWWDEGHPIKDI